MFLPPTTQKFKSHSNITDLYVIVCRAAIEEQYAKSLAKLAKSTLGDNEEGCGLVVTGRDNNLTAYLYFNRTLLKAWIGLKTEIRERSEAHSKLASKVTAQSPCLSSSPHAYKLKHISI